MTNCLLWQFDDFNSSLSMNGATGVQYQTL